MQRALTQVEQEVPHTSKIVVVVDDSGMAHEDSIEMQMMSNPMLSIAAASQSLKQGGDQPTAQQRRENGGDSISIPSARDSSARDSARRSPSVDFVPPPIHEI